MRFPSVFRLLHSSQAAVQCYSRARRLLRPDGRYIVITAVPKSGSTYLSHSLAEATGYTRSYFGYSYHNIEQELYLPKIVDAFGNGSVVHQHFRANPANLEIMSRFDIRPVVLVRNIFDAAVSVREHMIGEAADNLPAVFGPKDFNSWPAEKQFDFIVDYVLPWYVSFYASWKYAERDRKLPILWLQYEQMVRDWPSSIRSVLEFYRLNVSREDIDAAIQRMQAKPRERVRFNKGVAGRGAQSLSIEQTARVHRLTLSYPDVDFGPLGCVAGTFERQNA